MKKFLEAYGWYGTVAIITAYTLVSFSFVSADSYWYQILNATGALGIVFISLHKKAYQPAALNVIWTLIALIAIARMMF